ncbi:MAG: MBL fold metallo-hydrolase [Planctomycetota bacterium]|jgi:7,8-dihydropterin-6-yl-methyl-4-(beta-D-ribofuranosyl)aminobenzene 5'-phosphate synthase
MQDITITVVYDNSAYKEGLETGWGFSCIVTGAEKTILFDTGRDDAVVRNMEKLGISPESVDVVVLSHIHPDHTGGLESFLDKRPDVAVDLPKSFPAKFKEDAAGSGGQIVEVGQSEKICEGAYSTGELGRWIKEQSLVIQAEAGLIVIVGCAHQGIVKIVSKVKELIEGEILLVMGGFHLEWSSKGKIERVVSAFKECGVRCVGPGHCNGDKARAVFAEHFGKHCTNIGAGKVITTADLQ